MSSRINILSKRFRQGKISDEELRELEVLENEEDAKAPPEKALPGNVFRAGHGIPDTVWGEVKKMRPRF